jgi:type IV secretory pathway component VirB8
MTYLSEEKMTMILWRSIVVTLIISIAIIAIIFIIAFKQQVSYDCQKDDMPEAYKDACKNRSLK